MKPFAGMPATYCIGSDQYPATITRVSPSGATIWYRHDGQRGGLFLPAEREEHKATLRKDGTYRPAGRPCGYLSLGERSSYQDPSF